MDRGVRPTVSVIVPTFRRKRFLGPMVDALLAGSADEVLFVVDGSDDGSYEYLVERATADDRLRPITQVNRGRPAARQRGVDEATTEVALFLDDDLVPAMDVAAAHAKEHADTNDLVVVGAMPTTPPRWDARARLYDQQYREIVERWKDGGDVLADLWAGHFSLRRETFQRVGGLGPVTSMGYHDDWAFGLRCRAAGLRGRYCPDIVAHHAFQRSADGFLRDVAAQAADRQTMRRGVVAGPRGAALAPEPAGVARAVARSASRLPPRFRTTVLRTTLAMIDRIDARRLSQHAVAATRLVGAIERNAVAGELARRCPSIRAQLKAGVIVVVRSGEFVGETISSVLAQSRSDWELVVVDGDHDGAASQAERVIGRDKRARVIPRPFGEADLRECALAALSPDVAAVLFLDAGDVLQPRALEHLGHELAGDSRCVIVRPRGVEVDERGFPLSAAAPLHDRRPMLHSSGCLIRRSALAGSEGPSAALTMSGARRTVELPLVAFRAASTTSP